MNTDKEQADWKKQLAKAWGCNSISELDKSTQLTVEWIEKNVITPPAEEKTDAVEFAEWVAMEDYRMMDMGVWQHTVFTNSGSKITNRTTSELYQLFKSQPKQ